MIREGTKVILIQPHYSHVRHKEVLTGTEGRVKAIRMPGPDALVKFKGFAWPMSLPVEKLQEVTNAAL